MKIGIVGLGLIGGSFGRAIVSKTSHEVFGFDTDEKAMEGAFLVKAIHGELTEERLKELDLLVITLYPKGIREHLGNYCKWLKKGCVVMDCCGNKRSVVALMQELSTIFPYLEFVGAHPMAGREFSGIMHSSAVLFERASMILVPVKIDIQSLSDVKKLSYDVGFSRVVITTAENHDEIIGYSSQLAHLVSNAYVKSPLAYKHTGFSAGSFRDMTRVAKLNPEMWTQLMSENADNLIGELDVLIANLTEYKKALESGDTQGLYELLSQGNAVKKEIEKRSKADNEGNR